MILHIQSCLPVCQPHCFFSRTLHRIRGVTCSYPTTQALKHSFKCIEKLNWKHINVISWRADEMKANTFYIFECCKNETHIPITILLNTDHWKKQRRRVHVYIGYLKLDKSQPCQPIMKVYYLKNQIYLPVLHSYANYHEISNAVLVVHQDNSFSEQEHEYNLWY